MTDITKTASGNTTNGNSVNKLYPVMGLYAAADLPASSPVYIKSDGTVALCVNTVTENAQEVTTGVTLAQSSFVGFVGIDYASGEVCSIYGKGLIMGYASGMTPGALLFVSDTAGELATSAQVVGDLPVARVIDAKHILVIR
jgi:hypothetical protein